VALIVSMGFEVSTSAARSGFGRPSRGWRKMRWHRTAL